VLICVGLVFVLVSLEGSEGQPTIDGYSQTCDSSLPTSEQLENLIRKVEKVIASNEQQLKTTTCAPAS